MSKQPAAMPGHVLQSVESSYRVLMPWPKSAKVNLHFLHHNFDKCSCMQAGLLLLVHGEVTDPSVDFFDREKVFIEQKLKPIMDKVPELRIVMEHITTKDAADFVHNGPDNLAASITPQHMLLNRNALFLVRKLALSHALMHAVKATLDPTNATFGACVLLALLCACIVHAVKEGMTRQGARLWQDCCLYSIDV